MTIPLIIGRRALAACAVALAATGASADAIYGVVEWEGGGASAGPIPFAKVSACRGPGTADCSEAITGTDGSFSLTNLAPGRYDVSVTYDGGMISETLDVGGDGILEVRLVGR